MAMVYWRRFPERSRSGCDIRPAIRKKRPCVASSAKRDSAPQFIQLRNKRQVPIVRIKPDHRVRRSCRPPRSGKQNTIRPGGFCRCGLWPAANAMNLRVCRRRLLQHSEQPSQRAASSTTTYATTSGIAEFRARTIFDSPAGRSSSRPALSTARLAFELASTSSSARNPTFMIWQTAYRRSRRAKQPSPAPVAAGTFA